MVEVTGLEPAASCSQSRRATTCATPRYFYINFFLISLFSSLLCPPSCGSRNLFGSIVSLNIPTAAPKNARFFCHRQLSRFLPKAGALPPALHLDTAIIWIQLKYYSIINPSCQLFQFWFWFMIVGFNNALQKSKVSRWIERIGFVNNRIIMRNPTLPTKSPKEKPPQSQRQRGFTHGWDSGIWTHEWRSQSPLPYRLAISQYKRMPPAL